MKIELWSIGKSNETAIDKLIQEYSKRIHHYYSFEIKILKTPAGIEKLPIEIQKQKEAELVNSLLNTKDYLICLDENAKQKTSVEFANFLEKLFTQSYARIIFLIGGSYGIDNSLLQKSSTTLSLSSFTFPHQLVRVIFTEQLYRACSIIHNQKYHHQ